MTAEAVAPAEACRRATAAWEAAQGELLEARQGYERLAERIARLEKEAAAAHATPPADPRGPRAALQRVAPPATPAASLVQRRASEPDAPAPPSICARPKRRRMSIAAGASHGP